jgi:integrase/recombinase XerC
MGCAGKCLDWRGSETYITSMHDNLPVPASGYLFTVTERSRTERLVAEFLAGKKPTTVRAYGRDLDDFRAFLGRPSVNDAVRVLTVMTKGEATEAILAYRNRLAADGLQPATVNRRLAALRSLLQLAEQLEMVSYTVKVKNLPSRAYRDTRGPGRAGFKAMLAHLEERTDAKGRRDAALLRLMYDLALRRAEIVNLDLEHVDLAAGRISILGKGRTEREFVTLTRLSSEALSRWIEARGTDPGPLFVNFYRADPGGRLSSTSVYEVIREAGAATGLKVSPHGLRHAAITDALELTNGNIVKVAKFARHAKIDTTRIYNDNRTDDAGDVANLVSAASAV